MYSKFLIDSISPNLFVTSDPQFGAKGLFKCVPQRQAFGSIDRLHDELVNNWNAVVGKEDYVLCLGDFTQNLKDPIPSMELVEKYSRLLNGRKLLIRGNHDAEVTSWYYDSGWNCLIEYPIIFFENKLQWLSAPTPFSGCIICEVNGLRILFSHFAIYEAETDDRRYLVEKAFLRDLYDRYQCDINIHGHNHGRAIDHPECVSICVEHTQFAPVKLGQFLSQLQPMQDKKIA